MLNVDICGSKVLKTTFEHIADLIMAILACSSSISASSILILEQEDWSSPEGVT